MEIYTQADLEAAARVVRSAAARCEKIRPKFQDGTAQHSLLRNRLRALYTAEKLLNGGTADIPAEELRAALPPICSILHKTEAARRKYPEDTAAYRRFTPTVRAMEIVKALLEQGLSGKTET